MKYFKEIENNNELEYGMVHMLNSERYQNHLDEEPLMAMASMKR